MDLEHLANKTILITGSAKRIARDIVLELAKYQPRFILHYRESYKEILTLYETIQVYNKNSYFIKADFSNEQERNEFFQKINNENIDIVINSASIFPTYDNWNEFQYELYQKIFDVNLFTPLNLIKIIFKNQKKGLVINFLDASLKYNYTDHFLYRLSKICLERATYMLAKELAPNVRVNAISPGAILPPAQLNQNGVIEEKKTQEEIENFYKLSTEKIPLRIPGNTKYIIEAIKFLIQNDFLTGVNISVDGGEFI